MSPREPEESSPRTLEAALIRLALAVVPRPFRARFGDGMEGAVVDGLAERRGLHRLAFLLRSVGGVVRAGLRERLVPTPLPPPPSGPSPRGPLMDTLAQELRFALRALRRRPAFALVAVATLALGIGANSAIFSVVNGVLLRPLPFPEPDGLWMIWAYDMDRGPGEGGNMSKPDLADVAELPSVEGAEGYSATTFTLTGGDVPEQVGGARVTGGLLEILGAAPHLGRDLRREESVPGAASVVMVGYEFWQGRLGGRPEAIGSTLEISEVSYEIVGVAPRGFDFPDDAQLWTPVPLDPDGCGRGCHLLRAVMRAPAGATPARLQSELTDLAIRLGEAYPDSNHRKGFWAESLMDHRVGDVRRGLWLLLGAVAVVLLIACANVANLLLVRGSGRRAEVAVRSALGAGRGRMIAGVLSESAVLALAGTALGLALAWAAVAMLRDVPTAMIPRIDEVALDGRVLAFTAALGGIVTLLFGAAPALHLAGSPPGRALRSAGRGGGDRGEGRSRSLLLATEISLSVVLLAGAGLFLRSLAELRAVDLGFREREVTRFTLSLAESRYGTLAQVHAFYRQLEGRLAALPGVDAVGSAFGPPLGPYNVRGDVLVEGQPEPAPGEETHGNVDTVTPRYFETLGIPVLEGRGIEPTDVEGAEAVAVVSESFARENFPGGSALGERVRVTVGFGYETPEWWRVVGVVPDVRRTPTSDLEAGIYFPHAQFGPEFMSVHVRGAAGTAELVAAAREIVQELDPNVPLARVETLEQALDRETATTRFYLILVGTFAGLAVALAAVGLYGVVSYLVARRTREIGIRVALGAGTARVQGMVVLQGLRPAVAGLVVGVVAVLAAGSVMDGLLHDVTPHDSLVLSGVAGLVLGMTVLATVLPARRATRVDPCEALRAE